MRASFHKLFNEQFKKLGSKQKIKVRQAVEIFLKDTDSVSLRSHPLKGEWSKYRSISAGGDLRLHYRIIKNEEVIFVAVGTHSQLYK